MKEYVIFSLETHLFFGNHYLRILEHAQKNIPSHKCCETEASYGIM